MEPYDTLGQPFCATAFTPHCALRIGEVRPDTNIMVRKNTPSHPTTPKDNLLISPP